MRLLFDTPTLLWWFANDPQLSKMARATILDEGNDVFVSAASAWELATKYRVGKLPEARDVIPRFEQLVTADGFVYIPISHRHGLRAGSYQMTHADPFDRMLAAQAELEGMVLVTKDKAFADFPIRTLW
jgi:PIN domain nuclease of toxin-antitoxin system